MKAQAVFLASTLPIALCFSDTLPIVAWSSSRSPVLDRLAASGTSRASALLESILLDDAACEHDAIIFIEQPGLRASDLRTLPATSGLARILRSAPSSRQFPYLWPASPSCDMFDELVTSASMKCKSRLVSITPGQGTPGLYAGKKHLVRITLPPLSGDAQYRLTRMMEHDSRLSAEIQSVATAFPKHLVIYTGSSQQINMAKRQPSTSAVFVASPRDGILHRYQLLTPALITCLLVIVFVVVPVLFFGISALSSIQSPLRVEAPRNYNAQEKKNR